MARQLLIILADAYEEIEILVMTSIDYAQLLYKK